MASIHGVVFLILGAAMSAFAFFVEKKTEAAGMTFFIWVGIVMCAYGLVKLFIIRSGDKKIDETPDERLKKMLASKTSAGQNFKYCAKCGTKLPLRSNFCYMCGARS